LSAQQCNASSYRFSDCVSAAKALLIIIIAAQSLELYFFVGHGVFDLLEDILLSY